MKVFEFCVDLKKGYAPVPIIDTEEETEIRFAIEAKNRATATRAIKALLKGATNIQGYTGAYVGEALSYVDYKSEKGSGENEKRFRARKGISEKASAGIYADIDHKKKHVSGRLTLIHGIGRAQKRYLYGVDVLE